VIGQKTKMPTAIIFAITMPLSLIAITYTITPNQTIQQPPPPHANPKLEFLFNQKICIVQWIGLAAVVTLIFVGSGKRLCQFSRG
jgi:hypothetical protein